MRWWSAIRSSASLAFVLVAWLIGCVAPANGQTPPLVVPGAKTAATISAWVPTGNLNVSRWRHTATLLANGKVLVVGGWAQDAPLRSAELYDPTTGTWSMTGSLTAARVDHTATLLPNGKVLVVGGGFQDYAPDFAELYDPDTGMWSPTRYIQGRVLHTATLLQNGKVLVAGGSLVSGADAGAALYDPAAGTWSAAGRPKVPGRAYHRATLLQDGRVLVTGGLFDGGQDCPLASAEFYDPTLGVWSNAPPLTSARGSHTATLLPSGMVLIAGGATVSDYCQNPVANSAELYDPDAGSRVTGSLNANRGGHTASLMPDGRLLAAGGIALASQSSDTLDSAELYDPTTSGWEYTGKLNTARTYHTATLLTNGKVLVAGGVDAYGTNGAHGTNSAELYETFPANGNNSFVITSLFSDQAGLYQLIQLTELQGLDGQQHFAGLTLTSTSRSGVVKRFVFPNDLPAAKYGVPRRARQDGEPGASGKLLRLRRAGWISSYRARRTYRRRGSAIPEQQ